jgi:hypothetical protein
MNTKLIPLPAVGTPEWKAAMHTLVEAAKADNHDVMFATHLIIKNDEIVGYMSICATPFVSTWFDSKKLKVFDTMRAIDQAEAIMRHLGVKHYVTPCAETSPLRGLMEKMGHEKTGETTLFKKGL